jgi:serine/threonine protein kinase
MIRAAVMNKMPITDICDKSAGKSLGKYQKLILIGEGGCGRVYQAYDPDLERLVALKVLNRTYSDSPDHKELFFREIKLQAQLNLPGMIRVFEYGEVAGQLFYAMELIDGVTIDIYCQRKNLSMLAKIKLLGEVATTVAALHERDIVHRDIKPRNVMIDEHGNAKLLDLGVAASIREKEMFIGRFGVSGSPGYLAPEIFDDPAAATSAAADIYALGVLAYEILSGELPFDIDFLSLPEIGEVISLESPKPLKMNKKDTLPRDVEDIIKQSMCIAPSARPVADDFAEVFNRSRSRGSLGLMSLKKYAAIFLGSLVAATIVIMTIYHLPKSTRSPVKVKVIAPVPIKAITTPQIKTLQKVPIRKPVIKVPVKTGPFYLNTAPAGLKYLWSDARIEVSSGSKGALVVDLPTNVILKVKKGSKVIFQMDSRFQQQGCIYRPKGEILYLELSATKGGDARTYVWQSKSGKADIFQP